MLVRASVRYTDEQSREVLSVLTFDPQVERATRHVHFDLEDIDSAVAELDRQHADIEAIDA